jgi:hypothetical protein
MTTIRPFEAKDAADVAALFKAVFPQNCWASTPELAAYLRQTLCDNPWRDDDIPSWVACEDGNPVGFLAVRPRPMLHGKRPIRAAVGCQYLVHPRQRRSLVAVQLLRRFFQGPQDISLADGANSLSARMWEPLGGTISPVHSLSWIRALRPAQSALRLARLKSGWPRTVGSIGGPLAAMADTVAMRTPHFSFKRQLEEEDLDTKSFHAALTEHTARFPLRPLYDLPSLEWLLEQVAAKKRHGRLQARLLRDANGKMAGWFLYYLEEGGVSRVIQLAARHDRVRPTLEHLFQHASDRGAVALEGRMDPRFSEELGKMQCFFRNCGELTLLHSRDPALLAPLLSGNAFLTRLEGEWWLRFHGEPAQAPLKRGWLQRACRAAAASMTEPLLRT